MSMIVHINSYPGVGKLTIATQLTHFLSGKLLDNHTIYNVALALTEIKSEAYFETLRATRAIAFERVLELPQQTPVVLTNAHFTDSEWGNENWDATRVLAKKRGVPFIVVILSCSPEENARRLQNPARNAMRKPTDPKLFKGNLTGRKLIDRDADFRLHLDVTELSAQEAARKIEMWLAQLP